MSHPERTCLLSELPSHPPEILSIIKKFKLHSHLGHYMISKTKKKSQTEHYHYRPTAET